MTGAGTVQWMMVIIYNCKTKEWCSWIYSIHISQNCNVLHLWLYFYFTWVPFRACICTLNSATSLNWIKCEGLNSKLLHFPCNFSFSVNLNLQWSHSDQKPHHNWRLTLTFWKQFHTFTWSNITELFGWISSTRQQISTSKWV